jgi:hypothetical protein
MFFRKNEEKQAREQAMQAEIDRLRTLRPEELAVEVLPAMNSDALKGSIRGARIQEISKALLDGYGGSWTINTGVLLIPIREALQRLEHADLVMQMASGVDQATHWRITSTGQECLAAGDVAQRLGAG